VTGTLGDSKAGLEILLGGPHAGQPAPWERALVRKHIRPVPRIREGLLLSRNRLATSLMDISDGFWTDIRNLAEASGVGADIRIADLPVSASLRRFAADRKVDPSLLALYGGEDFELLFTVAREKIKGVTRFIRSGKIAASPVGTISRRKGIRFYDVSDKALRLKNGGFEHFISRVKK
jgi:thiamine-monophosphate kinase